MNDGLREMVKVPRSRWLHICCMVAGVVHLALGMRPFREVNFCLLIGDGRLVTVWPDVPWAFAFGCIGFAIVVTGWVLARRLRRTEGSLYHVFSPLTLLPLAFTGVFLRAILPWDLPGNVLFLTPVLVFTSVVARMFAHMSARPSGRGRDWPLVLGVFLCSSLLYAIIGVYFTTSVGEHSGDEGHYLAQARSLRVDGDLDLYRDLGSPAEDERVKYHISPASSGDAWYSLHPFGLSVPMAPFMSFGPFAWHAVLGLISGAGLAVVLLLCRRLGASMRTSVLVVVLFGLSAYWGIYSARALPEVLGGTLAASLLLAAVMQRDRCWKSVGLGAVAVGALPWVHTRFIPVSLLGFGFYGLFGLLDRQEQWKSKLPRLAVFTVLCVASYAAYLTVMTSMFGRASSYDVGGHLLTCPAAIWDNLASSRGVVYSLPAFACMLACAVILLKQRDTRMVALFAIAALSVVLVTSCGTHLIVGGKCVPGRFLLIVTPLFVPAAAIILERTNRTARWWFLLLSVFSCWVFVLTLLYLERLSKQFVFPVQTFSQVVPTFDHLCLPWLDPYEADLHPFGILFYGVTAFLFLPVARNRRVAMPALVLLIVAGIVAHANNPQRKRTVARPASTARTVMVADLSRTRCKVTGGEGTNAPVDIRSVLNLFDDFPTQAIACVTTKDLAVRQQGNLVSQPRLEVNDWDGRGYAWTTVVAPFRSGKGKRLLQLAGRLEGNAVPVLAVREGAHSIGEISLGTMAEGAFERSVSFATEDRGDLYILVRLEGGEGSLRIERISFCPVAAALVDALGVTLPSAEEL